MGDYPTHPEVEEALLTYLYRAGRPVRPSDVYEPLAVGFGLSQEQKTRPRPDTNESLWNNHVQWARNRLVQRGLMNKRPRGLWSLTAVGAARARG